MYVFPLKNKRFFNTVQFVAARSIWSELFIGCMA